MALCQLTICRLNIIQRIDVRDGDHYFALANGIGEVRQGKLIEIELAEADPAAARARVEEMCRQLLANPVIEDYQVEIAE